MKVTTHTSGKVFPDQGIVAVEADKPVIEESTAMPRGLAIQEQLRILLGQIFMSPSYNPSASGKRPHFQSPASRVGWKVVSSGFFRFPEMNLIYKEHLLKLSLNGKKPEILVIGVGQGQEPLSWLSFFYRDDKKLDELVELSTMDILARDEFVLQQYMRRESSIFNRHHAGSEEFKKVFDFDGKKGLFRIKDELIDHLNRVLDSNNSKWKSSIVDLTSDKQYDLVTCNRVLMHLGAEVQETAVQNLVRSVRPGGILMLDPPGNNESCADHSLVMDTGLFTEISKGVFRKTQIV